MAAMSMQNPIIPVRILLIPAIGPVPGLKWAPAPGWGAGNFRLNSPITEPKRLTCLHPGTGSDILYRIRNTTIWMEQAWTLLLWQVSLPVAGIIISSLQIFRQNRGWWIW